MVDMMASSFRTLEKVPGIVTQRLDKTKNKGEISKRVEKEKKNVVNV